VLATHDRSARPESMTLQRLRGVTIVAAVLALLATFFIAGTASAATCPTGWGSLPKTAAAMGTAHVTGVRTGIDTCWDRVVFDVNGPAAGYSVEYVDTVRAEGSGAALYVPGGAKLQVVLHHPAGALPYGVNQKAANVDGYPVLRSVTYGGSFEGYTTYGVGTRARLPFRVFTLDHRIVLDVARSW
jgi:hypothetical protein